MAPTKRRCGQGQRRNQHRWLRTKPSARPGQSPNRPGARSSPAASVRGSGRQSVRPHPQHRRRRRCSSAAAWPPAGAAHRKRTAADSSSSRSNRGRTGLPDARAADYPSHRDRE
jgi:hypothetical protein